ASVCEPSGDALRSRGPDAHLGALAAVDACARVALNRNIRPSFIAYARTINLRAVRIESLLCLALAPLYLLPEVLLFGGGRLLHLSIAWRLRSCLLALLTLLLLPRLRRLSITGLGVATLAIGLLHSANLGLDLAPVCEIE